ncbi:MAG: PASTA domain-containing protein, partial [Vicinamibacterales bacterium]
GIIVFQDVANKWKRTRRIWNQHSYHVTNVNEDATIPTNESAHWLIPGLNAFRTNAFVPGESEDETDSFTYVASDGVLESNPATVHIAIRTPNSGPQITSTPITAAADGVSYSYAAQAVDPDAGDILTFSLPTAPGGMSIDPASGLIQWTPAVAQQGTHDVIVKVADIRGLFALQAYQIAVAAALTVPDVVGQLQGAAEDAIVSAGLAIGAVTSRHSTGVPQGAVISQNPVGGSSAAAGAPVSYELSLGPPPVGTVPNVVGLQQTSAQQDVTAAGFANSVAGQNNSQVPVGIVMSQDPAGGTVAPASTVVSLVVSLGPPPGELDLDLDGFTGNQGDCNDTNSSINPAAFDVPGDGIDQNCNGVDSIAGDNTA